MIARNKALFRIAGALLSVFLFTGSLHLLRASQGSAPDFSCQAPSLQTSMIDIPLGAAGSQIAKILYEKKVVASSAAFFALAVSDQRAERIAPGIHEISRNLCARDALVQLLDADRIKDLVRIFEGAWNSEIIELLVNAGFVRSEILEAMKKVSLPQEISTLEGLLFPAQYSFASGTAASVAIDAMLQRGISEMTRLGVFQSRGRYNAQALLTIASIIQAEADEVDFSKVSRVIRNRLEKGMPLQMDSTIHYIKSDRGKIFLSTQSTYLNSPYNTYRNYQLPPGPIGNPGTKAIEAALKPAQGDWLYFITVAPRDTRFTSSYDEFSSWKIEYKKNLRQGAFEKESK